MKPEITWVYDADCPNVPEARAALREALEREGLEPQWVEYDRAAHARATSPLGVADDSRRRRRCRRRGGTRRRRVLSGLSDRARTLRRPVGRDYRRGDRAHRTALANTPQISKSAASGALGLAFVSTLAWLCCLLIASGAFGVALAAVAATVGPWWPLLATASLVFLVITIVRVVRGSGGSAAFLRDAQPAPASMAVFECHRFARGSVLRIGYFGSCCRIGGGAGVKVLLIVQPETVLRAA
jgi:hypothetical protein